MHGSVYYRLDNAEVETSFF